VLTAKYLSGFVLLRV